MEELKMEELKEEPKEEPKTEELKEEAKSEVDEPKKEIIFIEVFREKGIQVRLGGNSIIPFNDVLVHGIFEKAKFLALQEIAKARMEEMAKRDNIIKPAGMISSLKQAASKFPKIFK